MGIAERAALPPEIVAAQRQRRKRMLRLYGIGIGVVVLLCLGLLFVYGGFFSAGISADAQFSTHFTAAGSAMGRGDFAAAAQQMRAAMAIRDSYEVRYDLGIILLKEGTYADALAQLRRAMTFKRNSDAYWLAAIASLELHQPALGRSMAQQAVNLDPEEGYYHATLAMAERAAGYSSLAANEFATARRYDYTGQTMQQWIASAQFVTSKPVPSDG
jgi:tetratricopeptide (TPR) repeat protein